MCKKNVQTSPSWWLNHPLENYVPQYGSSSSKFQGINSNKSFKFPSSHDRLYEVLSFLSQTAGNWAVFAKGKTLQIRIFWTMDRSSGVLLDWFAFLCIYPFQKKVLGYQQSWKQLMPYIRTNGGQLVSNPHLRQLGTWECCRPPSQKK